MNKNMHLEASPAGGRVRSVLQVSASSRPLCFPGVRGCAAWQNHRPSSRSPPVHSGPHPSVLAYSPGITIWTHLFLASFHL